MAQPPINLTSETFDEVVNGDTPVLVDFWAAWCGPCKALEPVLARVAEKLDGRLVVAKVNVDAEPELSVRFQVQGIPRMTLFERGEVLANVLGAQSEDFLLKTLEPLL